MKLTRSKLKELVIEVLNEGDVMSKTVKYKDKDGNDKEATVGGILKKGENHPAYKDAKALADTGGDDKKGGNTNINIDADPFSKDDVGGPAHPNVPKKEPLSKWSDDKKDYEKLERWDYDKFQDMFYNNKPDKSLKKNVDNITNTFIKALDKFGKDEVEFADEKASTIKSDMVDDYVGKRFGLKRGDDDFDEAYDKVTEFVEEKEKEYYRAQMNKESVRESKIKRFTVKEVRMWMKKLEENRYKKVYNSDCRRVAWMVNNMKEDTMNMPISMRKKWTKAQYGRERYLATEFLKSKAEKMIESKLSENGILYKAGVKKYGKEGMKKICAAAGKKKSHADIGAIKDKYEKGKKEGIVREVKKENAIDVARRVVKDKSYDKASGLDLTTANFIVQVYDSQKKNPAVQKKLAKMSVVQLSKVIGKLLR